MSLPAPFNFLFVEDDLLCLKGNLREKPTYPMSLREKCPFFLKLHLHNFLNCGRLKVTYMHFYEFRTVKIVETKADLEHLWDGSWEYCCRWTTLKRYKPCHYIPEVLHRRRDLQQLNKSALLQYNHGIKELIYLPKLCFSNSFSLDTDVADLWCVNILILQ